MAKRAVLEESLESCHEELHRYYLEEEQLVRQQLGNLRVEVDEEGDRAVMRRAWSLFSPIWAVMLWVWDCMARFGALIAIEEYSQSPGLSAGVSAGPGAAAREKQA